MVFFHPHKRCVMIRFAVAVPVSADMNITDILLCAADPIRYRLYGSLECRFVLPFSLYKYNRFLLCFLFQFFQNLFEISYADLFRHTEMQSLFSYDLRQFLFHLCLQLFVVLYRCTLPNNRIPVRIGFDFCAIDKYRRFRKRHLSDRHQKFRELSLKIFTHRFKMILDKSVDRIVVRRRSAVQQKHEVHVFPARLLYVPRPVYPAHLGIDHHFQQTHRFMLDFSLYWICRCQLSHIHPFNDSAQQSHRIVLRDYYFLI